MEEVAAALAQPDGGKGALVGRGGDVLRAGQQRHQIGFVILPEQHRAAVLRDLEVAGEIARGMIAPGFARQIGADQLQLVLAAHGHEQAVARRAILRVGGATLDQPRLAAARRHDIDAAVAAPAVGGQPAARARGKGDGLAVGREARGDVVAGVGGHRLGRSAGGADGHDLAEAGVGPADEGEGAAVARPGRIGFEDAVVAARQAPRRRAGAGRLHPQFAERFDRRSGGRRALICAQRIILVWKRVGRRPRPWGGGFPRPRGRR